jgi:general secretion pathway protein F
MADLQQRRHGLFTRKRVSDEDVTLFTQELSWMIAAGIPLGRAVDLLATEAGSEGIGPALRTVRGDLRAGGNLSDALAAHPALFPAVYTSLVGLAEQAGTLAEVLAWLHNSRVDAQALRRKIRSAMIYPGFLVCVAITAVAVIMLAVIPQMKAIAPADGAAKGAAMGRLIAISDWLAVYWPYLLGGLAGAGVLISLMLQRASVRRALQEALSRLPVIGPVHRTFHLAELTRTLAMLTEAGLPLADALRLARRTTAAPRLARVVAGMEAALRAGDDVTGPLRAAPNIPPLLVSLLRVGMETGEIGPSLRQASRIFDDKTRHATERGLAVLEPAIILVISSVIGGIIYIVVGALMAVNDLFI